MGQLSHLIYSNVLTATDELHITGTADVITTSENADENTSMIAGHPVTIDGNAKVTGYASSIGIDSSAGSADYSVKITDQANVTINAAYNHSREAIAASGSIIISGNAIVDCETFCDVEPEYGHPPTLYADISNPESEGIFITDSATVTANGYGHALNTWGNIVISGGSVTASSKNGAWGIWAEENFSLSGDNTILCASGSMGIGAAGNVTISGGTVSECDYIFTNGWYNTEEESASISIEGGHIIGGVVQNEGTNGDVYISNGTLEGLDYIYSGYGNIEVSGGHIIGSYLQSDGDNGNIYISGGTMEEIEFIYTSQGSIYISGGDISAYYDGLGANIKAANVVDITNANIAVTSLENAAIVGDEINIHGAGTVVEANSDCEDSAAILSYGSLYITDGAIVKAMSPYFGLYVPNDNTIFILRDAWVETIETNSNIGVGNSVLFEDTVGQVYGTANVPGDVEVPEDATLTVPQDASLTVPTVLTNNESIVVEGDMVVTADGQIAGEGSISVSGALAYQGTGTDAVAGTVTLVDTGKVYSQSDISTVLSNATPSEDKTYQETVYAYAWEKAPNVYAIVLPVGVNGTVTASPESATENATVTLTVTPSKGYELKSLTVIRTDDDTEIQIDPVGESKYSFQMPASDVTVTAQFQITHCDGDTDCPSGAYEDVVEDAWYHDYVDFVLRRGYMVGISEGPYIFGTELHLTRAQAIQTLYQIEGKPGTSYVTDYNDVSDNQWFAQAIAWGTENGIVEGRDDGTFDPDGNITREELVTMLYRYVKEYKILSVETEGGIPETFTDADQAGSYAVDAFAWAIDRGIVNGITDTTLEPRTLSRRCEMAKLIATLCAVYPEIP